MTEPSYKYDVAFSFLAGDEALAMSINELIKDRLTSFIYSKKQEELAGTDGEESFNTVFSTEARIVFVLYRNGWGETPWTRIEETAIKNRAFDDGYDFVIFAPLDKPPSIPKYLPKTRLWVGLDRWGIEGAASVIEARVQEVGGTPKQESAEDRVNRLSREINDEKERKSFLDSFDGVKLANDEVVNLFNTLQQAVQNNSDIYIDSNARECIITGQGYRVRISWELSSSNTLENSSLYVSLWDNRVNAHPFNKAKRLKEIEFQFDLSKSKSPFWKEARKSETTYSTEGLAKFVVTMLLNKILETNKMKR